MNGQFRPEAMYKTTNMEEIEIIPFETAVVGTAFCFDTRTHELLVDLGNSWTGFIPEDEITVYDYSYSEGRSIPRQIHGIIGTRVRAIVTEVREGHKLKLSRKMSMIQAWNLLENNTKYTACVKNSVEHGIFFDIGNGLITYSSKTDCSEIRISDTNIWFEFGDTAKVLLLDKGECASSRITCSYKLAYPDINEAKDFIHIGDVFHVQIGMGKVKNGYFCQIGPRIKGIIDTCEVLREGDIVKGVVRKITDKGLRLKHIY